MNKKKSGKDKHIFETSALTACLDIGKLLASTLNLDKILSVIMKKISLLIPARNWSLLLIDKITKDLTFDVVVGLDKKKLDGIHIPLGKGVCGRVAETGKSIFLSNAEHDPNINRSIDNLTGFTTKSIICVPLKIHGKILGVIEIVNINKMDHFKTQYLPTLLILADYAAIAIENSHYVSKIQKMSITDEYTGLYNARYLHDILGNMIKKSLKQKKQFSILFGDIDDFKEVVDEHGHLSGSKVLKKIGKTILNCLSEKDTLIKYGGDEYVIILPGCNKQQAKKIVERILDAIRSSTYLKSEKKQIKVTASFGIAGFPEDATTKKELLLIADSSMYKMKKTCKNGICVL